MRVAVIVPVYNVEPYLREFMDSLCRQTFQDFDIIAVDDASTDRSAEILESYKGYFRERLLIIHNIDNKGAGEARNIGLENISEGNEYVAFLDSDDYLECTYFEKMVSAADRYDADIVMCGCDRFDDLTGKKSKGEMISNPEDIIFDVSACRELAYINTFVWNKLFRKTTIRSIRFPLMRRWEEFVFLFRAIPISNRIKFLNEVLYHYRNRSGSLTNGFTEEMCSSALSGLRDEIACFRKEADSYRIIKESFEAQVFVRCGLGAVGRLSFKNMKKAGYYVRQMKGYMDETIPDWRRNRYLNIRYCFDKGYKETAVAVTALLYRWNLFILFIWVYWFTMNILKKDIQW